MMHTDVFTWTPLDIPGMDALVICHHLNVDSTCRLVKQKKRNIGVKKQHAAKEEGKKLLEANFTDKVQYPNWLANITLVPKPSKKWRMCVDFTDFNKAYLKNSFPLPRIDQIGEHQMLSFVDAFLGYN